MRVLIIKMSSMGDVIHTLPALTDARKAIPGITFDWVVEESFKEIPAWHPNVKNVFPIRLRSWRKNLFKKNTFQEWRQFKNKLREQHYDLVIDAQGLWKSAFVSCFAKGKRAGLNFKSAREPYAAFFYSKKYAVAKDQHAISRVRELFAKALNYPVPINVPDYGVAKNLLSKEKSEKDYLVFLHGTTWPTKHWPENYWIQLAKLASQNDFQIKLPWGNDVEQERAKRIAGDCETAEVLPKLNIQAIAKVLANAKGIVAVDTGLGHLAAALDVPTISLYGPTNPTLTGALGRSQLHLKADFSCAPCLSRECHFKKDEEFKVDPPCFAHLPPQLVWHELLKIIS